MSGPFRAELRPLDQLPFDDSFVRQLPGETPPASLLHRSREVRGAAWAAAEPTPVAAPRIVAFSESVGALLGLATPSETGLEAAVLGGNRLLPGMRPYAACYGGHQFGNWAGQLGDGRAMTLCEVLTANGQRLEMQLKGGGPTAFSRRSDGRAVLRSSLREYLCSEAMFHLGVPTTRALCLVTTGDDVVRDMFYDGHPRKEPGAIVTRVAPTFLRLGNFELFASRGEHALNRSLLAWLFTHHLPELSPGSGGVTDDSVVSFFDGVVSKTARMVADWMHVGFVHGVMNTDNLSVLGVTLDYGPYGFLDAWDPDFTPNTTDFGGRRYRYAHQPGIAHWNLHRFALALAPLVSDPRRLEAPLNGFVDHFQGHWLERMSARLGLSLRAGEPRDTALIDGLIELLGAVETDPTLLLRRLADVALRASTALPGAVREADLLEPLAIAFYDAERSPEGDADLRARWALWLAEWHSRCRLTQVPVAERVARMRAASPAIIPRNYLAQEAIIAAEQGDFSVLERLMDACRHPYAERPEHARYVAKRPDWARDSPGCSALSCSS